MRELITGAKALEADATESEADAIDLQAQAFDLAAIYSEGAASVDLGPFLSDSTETRGLERAAYNRDMAEGARKRAESRRAYASLVRVVPLRDESGTGLRDRAALCREGAAIFREAAKTDRRSAAYYLGETGTAFDRAATAFDLVATALDRAAIAYDRAAAAQAEHD